MQPKFHIKRGDTVVVLAGSQKGKQGKVLQLLPAKQRAVVEGVGLIKRHLKKSQEHPNGAIVEREGSIHISNLMLLAHWEARRSKRGQPTEAKAS